MVLILWILRVIWFLSCVPLPIWRRAINLRLLQHSFSCHLWCWNLLPLKCLLFHIWRCLKRVYMLLIKLDRSRGIWWGFPASALSSCRLFFFLNLFLLLILLLGMTAMLLGPKGNKNSLSAFFLFFINLLPLSLL